MQSFNKTTPIKLINDHFQNYKVYGIPKAQLIIADIPYNVGKNAYASSTEWYKDGDIQKGESEKANKNFFDTDVNFKIAEFFHFCSKMLVKEPKETGKAPAMIIFCAFEQIQDVIKYAKDYGFNNYIPLVFIKNYSSQVLKANMRVVGACEYALLFYREKLPKFNNEGKMIFNWFNFEKETTKKIHPTQKPVKLLKELIRIFTDPGDVVIDPVAGSGSTLKAAAALGRPTYGFEIKKDFYNKAKNNMLNSIQLEMF